MMQQTVGNVAAVQPSTDPVVTVALDAAPGFHIKNAKGAQNQKQKKKKNLANNVSEDDTNVEDDKTTRKKMTMSMLRQQANAQLA